MLGGGPGDAGVARRRRASCSIAPRRGASAVGGDRLSRRRRDRRDDLDARSTTTSTYLRVERGLAPATIRAYRGDLADFAARRAATARGVGPAPGRRARLPRRADASRPAARPGLAPTSLRRRAAALKGFYRFAFGEGLIERDVAAHLDLPRQPRLLPETLTSPRSSGCSRPARRTGRLRDRALLELLYAAGPAGQRGARARSRGPLARRRFVRVIGKGDKERLVPVGDDRARLARALARRAARRRCSRWHHVAPVARRAAVPRRSRPAARPPAGVGDRSAAPRATRRPARPGQPAHAAPLVRDASARGRRRPAGRPGVARPCEYLHDPALHPSDRGADPGGLRRAHPRA